MLALVTDLAVFRTVPSRVSRREVVMGSSTWMRIMAVLAAVAGALGVTAAPVGASSPRASRGASVPSDHPTIQKAIDAAAPGSTIRVARGTYTEELVITKDLTLLGDGMQSIIRSPSTLTPFAVHEPDGRALTAIVRVGGGAHVRMSGFTVEGPIPCGEEVTGVQVVEGATLSLSRSHVTGIQADPSACAPADAAGRAIVYGLPAHIVMNGRVGSPAYGRVSGVVVDHYQHAGISITGPVPGAISRVSVVDSEVLGGWTLPSFQYGIDIEDGAAADVVGNRIHNNICGGAPCGPDPINQAQGAGILVVGPSGAVHIVGNHLMGNDAGIYQVVSAGCCRISGNRLERNRFFGIVIQDGDGRADGNTISGGQVGIGVVADFLDTAAVLAGDRITGATVASVEEIDCCGVTATAIVRPARH
jgi:parallel beta-helix repeat protein